VSDKVKENLVEMEKKLTEYINKGRVIGFREVRDEPVMAVKPDKSKIKPLAKIKNYEGKFLAVDCSTRTLKRANNWGVYLMRVAYASVKGKEVDWGYEESITSVVGDRHTRYSFLRDRRLQLESEMALKILNEVAKRDLGGTKLLRRLNKGDYILLDGASFFGGKRGFYSSLYEVALREKVNLLTISKQSPMLHDEKGRDFMAATCMLAHYPTWVYHPIRKANKDEHLYGDVSLVKLCQDSLRVFRCDIMEYLTNHEVSALLSPLTVISEDPRCLGYPVTLWLAHDFSSPSDSKLLHYHDQVEEKLADAELLDVLRLEELSCNFPDELHGVKHPFRWERIAHV